MIEILGQLIRSEFTEDEKLNSEKINVIKGKFFEMLVKRFDDKDSHCREKLICEFILLI